MTKPAGENGKRILVRWKAQQNDSGSLKQIEVRDEEGLVCNFVIPAARCTWREEPRLSAISGVCRISDETASDSEGLKWHFG